MAMEIEQTFTLSDIDIKQAVAEYLTKHQGVVVTAPQVKINVSAGSPYYNQFDQGTPASVKITATIKPTPTSREIPFAKDADERYR
jgi:hypothetical protein